MGKAEVDPFLAELEQMDMATLAAIEEVNPVGASFVVDCWVELHIVVGSFAWVGVGPSNVALKLGALLVAPSFQADQLAVR